MNRAKVMGPLSLISSFIISSREGMRWIIAWRREDYNWRASYNIQERLHHFRVELAIGADCELVKGVVLARCGPVRAVRGHGVVRVRDAQYARHERYLLAFQPGRLSAPVHPLVVAPDDGQKVLELLDGSKYLAAPVRV